MLSMSGPHFREAMSRLGAAVNVITSAGSSGRVGFTATAVCSVSDQPPTLLVCMNRSSSLHTVLQENGVLCVNTLADAQHHLSPVFAGLTGVWGEDRFKAASWHELTTGAPVLNDALVSFDCSIDRAIEVGTHSVFFCSVVDVATKMDGNPLLYFGRQYCSTLHLEVAATHTK
jgi:flavin reductase